ncbi:hypothetical protein JCM6882_003197 [Rhodosporidiobolus microsporus]
MPPRLLPGDGQLVVSLDNQRRAVPETVDFSYPLKLIVPARRFLPRLQCVYVIGYGGGLVAGDRVRLKVDVKEGTTLVMLTQGSTKVFKTRPGRFLHAPSSLPPTSALTSTLQLYRLSVAPSSFLILLPAPVTCFSRSRYSQRQVVHLADETSSLVLLDWYTAGRVGMDDKHKGKGAENWKFERYRSENEVWLGERRIAKDVLLLEDENAPPPSAAEDPTRSPLDVLSPSPPPSADAPPHPAHETTYSPRVSPYSCYATLFLFGPHTAPLLAALNRAFTALTHYKQPRPYSLVWSFSTLPGHPGGGGVARCAGAEAEQVREWVTHVLTEGGMGGMISEDLWRTAFS